MMRKLIILLAFALFSGNLQAQLFSKERLANLETFDKRFLSWGYFLGFNQYDFKIEYSGPQAQDIAVDRVGGFNVGLIGDMRINEYMNLRLEPGLYFTQRDLRFPGFTEDSKRGEIYLYPRAFAFKGFHQKTEQLQTLYCRWSLHRLEPIQ